MEMAYCLAFYKYCNSAAVRRFKFSFGPAVAFLFFMLIMPFVFYSKPTGASEGIGVVASILNICMYASPLTIMREVWSSKSVKYMPLHLSIATFLCSFAWMCYGITVNDGPILVCNVTGTILGAGQVALYFMVYFHPDRNEQDGNYTPILENDVEEVSPSSEHVGVTDDDMAVL